jgi:valyl-tRNA synthetase
METGADILFFWVARMAMLCGVLDPNSPSDGLRSPFSEVLLHGMVRDAKGRKMSKSLGNGIDPLAVVQGRNRKDLEDNLLSSPAVASNPEILRTAIESLRQDLPNGIPQCGADALRYTLANYCTRQSRLVNFDVYRCETHRRFGNKLWNATRFVLGKLEEVSPDQILPIDLLQRNHTLSPMDEWILHRLSKCVAEVDGSLERREFGFATSGIHDFLVNDFCDMYVEYAKGEISSGSASAERTQAVLLHSLDTALRLLHPFMPFLTEELWQRLPLTPARRDGVSSLMVARFPRSSDLIHSQFASESADRCGTALREVIGAVRQLREKAGGKCRGDVLFVCSDQQACATIKDYAEFVSRVCRNGGSIDGAVSQEAAPGDWETSASVPLDTVQAVVYFRRSDMDAAEKLAVENRNAGRAAAVRSKLEKLEAVTSSEAFRKNAPAAVQEKNAERIAQLRHQLQQYEEGG